MAAAAHAQVGTPVADVEMPALAGGKERLLRDVGANVLVFFRPNHERSGAGLKELTRCQNELSGKSVHWTAIVSSSAPSESAAAAVRDAGLAAPVLVDTGDSLYGSLGVSLHPVVVIIGPDRKLAAFEPFRSVDYCATVSARIRHVLREISDDELQNVLAPPKAVEGGNGQIARRYRAMAEALFKAKNYDKALENVQKSLEKDPSLAPAHALMGEILFTQGNCAAATQAFRKALEIDATNALAMDGIERCRTAR